MLNDNHQEIQRDSMIFSATNSSLTVKSMGHFAFSNAYPAT